jgi:hypothetical protein
VLIAAGWVVVAHQPHGNWARHHALSWSSGIHILGFVNELTTYVSVLAFGIGLVFGYSLDTTGPRRRAATVDRRQDVVAPADHRASDEPLTAEEPAGGPGTDPVAAEGSPVDEAPPTQTTDRS